MTLWQAGKYATETQLGAIAEQVVATQMILDSKGRLSPFYPLADDMGIDLLVYDKKTGRSVPLQIKSRTKTLNRHPKIVHFQIGETTFNPKFSGYILCLLVQRDFGIERAWLIPMAKFKDVASRRVNTGTYTIRPSKDMNSRDKFQSYRCKDLQEVTKRILDDLHRDDRP